MTERLRGYFSYMLRIWRSGHEEGTTWRASVECPVTRERRIFASLEDLWIFLQAQTATEHEERGKEI